MKKVLVIGAIVLDIIVEMKSLPKTGEDVCINSQTMSLGGCAYNVVQILEALNTPYTLFAPIGTGIYSDFITKELEKENIKAEIKIDEKDNGYCLCIVENGGERTFITYTGVEADFERKWFENIDVSEYDSVYISGYEIEEKGGDSIIEFLEKNTNLIIYYAPGPRINYISKEKNEKIMKLNPILHMNEKEALEYTKENSVKKAIKKLRKESENIVIITLGENGSLVFDKEIEKIPTRSVNVVDTIGAGDSNIGAIIARRKMGDDILSSVKIANYISSIIVGQKGCKFYKNKFDIEEI